MSIDNLPKADYAKNMRLIGYSDQGGRCDGVQIMVQDGYAYIGHSFRTVFRSSTSATRAIPRPSTM